MPQKSFELIRHAYSYSSSVTHSGGETYSLPQTDYGAYGMHLDAFFNSLSTTEGGASNLVAWFLSDKGLSFYISENTNKIASDISNRFPIEENTKGRGLIDLRGSPDWKYVIGDGIISDTLASSSGSTNAYTEGIKKIFNSFKNAYPNIEWAIAGIPHLPFFMTYAPDIGLSASMKVDKFEPTFPFDQWDANHPTGVYDRFFGWGNVPKNLGDYYENLAKTGIQNVILEECDPDWICPDVRIPHKVNLNFCRSGYLYDDGYIRNRKTCDIAVNYARNNLKKVFAEISTIYPSRGLNEYDNPIHPANSIDDPYAYMYRPFIDDAVGVTNDPEILYNYSEAISKSQSLSAAATDAYYPIEVFQHEIIKAAADSDCNGFLISDPVSGLIELACTASTGALNDWTYHASDGYPIGFNENLDLDEFGTPKPGNYTIESLTPDSVKTTRNRGRNMFSAILFGGFRGDNNPPAYEPDKGWTASWVKNELRRFASNQTKGMLDRIREVVQIGKSELVAGKNGWERTLPQQEDRKVTFPEQVTTNTIASDSVYGTQTWPLSGGPIICCPPPDDPGQTAECEDPTSPDCGTCFTYSCAYNVPGSPDIVCCIIYCGAPPGGGDSPCGDFEGIPNPCPRCGDGNSESTSLLGLIVKGSDYDYVLDRTNAKRVEENRFTLYRNHAEPIAKNTNLGAREKDASRNTILRNREHRPTMFDPRFAMYAIKTFAEKDLIRHQVFGNYKKED